MRSTLRAVRPVLVAICTSLLVFSTFAAERPRLQLLNGSNEPIDIFWLKSDSERVPNGSIEAGKDSVITTTIGHKFLMVGREDKVEATVTSEVPIQGFRFDPKGKQGVPAFYTQRVEAHGFPIVASAKVNPYALKEAAFLIDIMLAKRPDIREALIKSGARMCIMAHNEFTTDLPEFTRMGEGRMRGFETISGKDYWDARARGTGGSQTDPFCTSAEENILCYPGDPYSTECIVIHEFAHCMHLRGMENVDPTFDRRLKATYDAAMKAGLWKGKYASVNHHEYFAEGVQSWFDNNRENDHDHNHVNTRQELLEYDPGLAAMCREVFGDTELKYTKPITRLTGHMAGYDPGKAPTFVWPDRLQKAKAEIRRQAEERSRKGEAAKPTAKAVVHDSKLTLDRIFRAKEFNEEKAPSLRWSKLTSDYFTIEAAPKGGKGRDLVRNNPASGHKEVMVPASDFIPEGKELPLSVTSFEFSTDESKLLIFTNAKRVWRSNTRGDYWVLDLTTRKLTKLGGNAAPSTLMFAKFAPDGSRVAYVRENNLYVQDLRWMRITALTKDGSDTVINGTSDWVNEEELRLRDCFRWSPDGRSIAFWQFDTRGVREFHLMNNTDDTYPQITSFPYPKVGETNSATRVGVVSASGGRVRWLNIPGDPREHYLPHLEWTTNGTQLLVQQLNRLQNTNRVMVANPKTGATRVLLTETDAAWLENENPFRWVNDGKNFLWLSERDGWRHAYLADVQGDGFSKITDGDFDVINVEAVDDVGGWLYYAASPDNPTQRYLYRVPLAGGRAERLSPSHQAGWHTYDISPDTHWAVHTYSTFDTPPVGELVSLPDHKVARVLVENRKLREKVAALKLPRTEFLNVDVGGGISLDAWCIKPPDLDPSVKHPLLMNVYGEPHGQTVKDKWKGATGLWHSMLAQQGFIVASVDNRGTPLPRGHDWRKVVYRQIGILASQEQAAAVRDLLKRMPYADAQRVGVWGWSGGGSMSLNAIFRYPDVYSTAIAVAPVANQLLYDTIYQERYMGLPDDNAKGYREGSPLTYAHQLRGNLLVVHGTGDDNVHYQGTELLVNELIAQNKQFTIMPYPNRSHAIAEGTNVTRHLYGTLTSYLNEHLLGKPSPQSDVHLAGDSADVIEREVRDVEGWKVHINKIMLTESDRKLTERALELLRTMLQEIIRVVPAKAVAELRKVPLYFSPEYPNKRPGAEFHPDAGWLRAHGRDPVMAKGVEFSNIRIFDAEVRRMPNFALHELAHAYHNRVLGGNFGNAEIKTAYEHAKAGGEYDRVERQDSEGRKRMDKAYAMTNPQEYFAETTEAYFSKNDFQPYTKEELKTFDPEMFKLLGKLWGVTAE